MAALEDRTRELKASTASEEEMVRVSANAHEVFAIAVALLALGITLGGMAIGTERKFLWTVGLVFGALGTLGTGISVLIMLS